MERKNCWEVMACGLEPGGVNAAESGVCPAAVSGRYDGANHGIFAGRFCWVIRNTICGCKKTGMREEQLMNCINCRFMQQVQDEEGSEFILLPQGEDFFL